MLTVSRGCVLDDPKSALQLYCQGRRTRRDLHCRLDGPNVSVRKQMSKESMYEPKRSLDGEENFTQLN
jgi:hypothetical protein